MKNILFLGILFCSTIVFAQKNIYESNRFDELSSEHEELAIIPFITELDLDDNISKEEMKNLEEKEGYAVQNALETYFSKRKQKKKSSVDFQNIKNTNAILAQHNINFSNIDVYTIKELSEILGVDGIISGNIDLNVLLSNGVSTGLLNGNTVPAAPSTNRGNKVGNTGKNAPTSGTACSTGFPGNSSVSAALGTKGGAKNKKISPLGPLKL